MPNHAWSVDGRHVELLDGLQLQFVIDGTVVARIPIWPGQAGDFPVVIERKGFIIRRTRGWIRFTTELIDPNGGIVPKVKPRPW